MPLTATLISAAATRRSAAGLLLSLACSSSSPGDVALDSTNPGGSGGPGNTAVPQLLFEEKFEDNQFAARGWYDIPATGFTSVTTAEHATGSRQSLEAKFAAGATSPSPYAGGRHLFTPSESVYLTYWVKYSTNWVGSGKTYHPHEFHFLTTEDAPYVGPASTFLTAYIEHNYQSAGGVASIGIQDAKNIDGTRANQDLTNVTEQRAVAGCNGNPDGTVGACYRVGTEWLNGKTWTSAQAVFGAAPGPSYKNNWHRVETYFQLNTISGGKGQLDGIAQYWIDGQLVIDRHNVIFRTGAHPNMKFNQFLMAPYIGDGSPVAQSMWIDDIKVMTARPTP
jgi:hypothetical protein